MVRSVWKGVLFWIYLGHLAAYATGVLFNINTVLDNTSTPLSRYMTFIPVNAIRFSYTLSLKKPMLNAQHNSKRPLYLFIQPYSNNPFLPFSCFTSQTHSLILPKHSSSVPQISS